MRNAVDTGLVYGSSTRSLVETDDLLEPVEKALLDVLRLAADTAQLMERLLLFLSQVGRNNDSHINDLVATPTRTQVRDAAPVDAKQLAVLSTGWDLDPFRPVHRGNLDRVARRTCPAPRHGGQVCGDVPASAPVPWQDSHASARGMVSSRSTPRTDSSKLSRRSSRRSAPRRGPVRVRPAAAVPKNMSKMSLMPPKPAPPKS